MSDNKDMRPSGTPQQLEQRRRKAIALLEQGYRNQEVARLVGASSGTICDWKKAYQKRGEAFFEAHSPPGRTPGLSDKQINRLTTLLLKGPRKHGYLTELWTLRRIAEVIEKHFGIAYDPSNSMQLGSQGSIVGNLGIDMFAETPSLGAVFSD